MSLIAGNLGAVQRLLDDAKIPWGVCAGSAAHLYGVRRPIKNVDILLPQGCLRQVRDILEKNRLTAQYDGRILLWRGIKLFDDLTVTIAGMRYPFLMDQPMQDHLRRLPLLGVRALILAPEDVLAHKSLLILGDNTPGKPHRDDFGAIVRMQGERLDNAYLAQRLDLCQARIQVQHLFVEANLALPAQ
jgi:hypothetical protein